MEEEEVDSLSVA